MKQFCWRLISTTIATYGAFSLFLPEPAAAQSRACTPYTLEFSVLTSRGPVPAGDLKGKTAMDFSNFTIFRVPIAGARESWGMGQKLLETKYTAELPDSDFAELSKLCATQYKVLDCSIFSTWNNSNASTGRPVTLSFTDTPTGRSGLSVSIARWNGGPAPAPAPGAIAPVRVVSPDANPVEYKTYPFPVQFKVIEACSAK